MGENQIKRKLETELEKEINDELQVVYIMSRIRKLLELNDQKDKYKNLNFYCNWALHSRLDKLRNFTPELIKFIENKDNGAFLKFDYLHIDLKDFLHTYKLPTKLIDDSNNFLRFINLLVEVYSHTPLIFLSKAPKQHYFITIEEPVTTIPESLLNISYKVVLAEETELEKLINEYK